MFAGLAKRSRKGVFRIRQAWSPTGRLRSPTCGTKGSSKDLSWPDLIFLDLNLPKKSGSEVLAELKTDSELRDIPIIVLTTSPMERQALVRTYDLPANSYLLKPLNWTRFLDAVRCYTDLKLVIVRDTQ